MHNAKMGVRLDFPAFRSPQRKKERKSYLYWCWRILFLEWSISTPTSIVYLRPEIPSPSYLIGQAARANVWGATTSLVRMDERALRRAVNQKVVALCCIMLLFSLS